MEPSKFAAFLWRTLHRIGVSAGAFVLTTAFFLYQQVRRTTMTLRTLRHRPSLREGLEAAAFFVGPKGLLTSVVGAYLEFYRDDFHPWDHDNRALIDAWKAEHEATVLA